MLALKLLWLLALFLFLGQHFGGLQSRQCSTWLSLDFPGLNSRFTTYWMCDMGQMIFPFNVSLKWERSLSPEITGRIKREKNKRPWWSSLECPSWLLFDSWFPLTASEAPGEWCASLCFMTPAPSTALLKGFQVWAVLLGSVNQCLIKNTHSVLFHTKIFVRDWHRYPNAFLV